MAADPIHGNIVLFDILSSAQIRLKFYALHI